MGLPPWAHALAGASGGVAATALLHPLDTLRTHRQSLTAISATAPLRTLLSSPATLYRGIGPSLAGGGLSWGAYLSLYAAMRRLDGGALPAGAAAAAAGAGVALLTTPVWVVKTRVQLGGGMSATAVARGVAATDGWRGFYRGLGANLLLVSHGVVQMAAYEAAKAWLTAAPPSAASAAEGDTLVSLSGGGRGVSVRDSLLASTVSKVAASVATYPLQVVRTAMQEAARATAPHATTPAAATTTAASVSATPRTAAHAGAAASPPSSRGVGDIRVRPVAAAATAAGGTSVVTATTVGGVPSPPSLPRSPLPAARRVWDVFGVAREVVAARGMRGLWAGLGANLARVTPAAAVTFVVYEQSLRMIAAVAGD
ncbi:hypothetical protein MMPV_005476 [Pyropia vietnamensis]